MMQIRTPIQELVVFLEVEEFASNGLELKCEFF